MGPIEVKIKIYRGKIKRGAIVLANKKGEAYITTSSSFKYINKRAVGIVNKIYENGFVSLFVCGIYNIDQKNIPTGHAIASTNQGEVLKVKLKKETK